MNIIERGKLKNKFKHKLRNIVMWAIRIILFPIWICVLLNEKYKIVQKFKKHRKYDLEKVKKHLLKCIANYFIKYNNTELFISDRYCCYEDDYDLHEIIHLFETWKSFNPSQYLIDYRNNCEIDPNYYFDWLSNYKGNLFNVEICDTSHGYKDDDGCTIPSFVLTNNGDKEPCKMIKITVE